MLLEEEETDWEADERILVLKLHLKPGIITANSSVV